MLRDLLHLFYPTSCAACDQVLLKNENTLCISCRHQLPRYNFQYHNAEIIKKVFSGRILIQNATALLIFEKQGLVQNIIHNLKYRGQEDIGSVLGQWLGNEIFKSTSYQEITMVIPVPLHRKRFRERGYNQVAKFGKEIAKIFEVPYEEKILIKTKYTYKQAKSGGYERWDNIVGSFGLQNPNKLKNQHILLVDDLLTTGATLEACATELMQVSGVKISIATMAIAL